MGERAAMQEGLSLRTRFKTGIGVEGEGNKEKVREHALNSVGGTQE